MRNGPELWDQILAKMPAGAVVAGGAVRDWLLDVEPKDIDVFMGPDFEFQPPPTQQKFYMGAFDARMGLFRIDNVHERQAEYAAVSNISLVSSGEMFGFRVDAIVIDDFDAATLVDGFDFGVTRSWYDGTIHDTVEARRDRATRTVTQLLPSRGKRQNTRFKRFNERMGGDWTFRKAVP